MGPPFSSLDLDEPGNDKLINDLTNFLELRMNRKNLLLKDWQQKRECFYYCCYILLFSYKWLLKSGRPIIVSKTTPCKVKCRCPKAIITCTVHRIHFVIVYLQGSTWQVIWEDSNWWKCFFYPFSDHSICHRIPSSCRLSVW